MKVQMESALGNTVDGLIDGPKVEYIKQNVISRIFFVAEQSTIASVMYMCDPPELPKAKVR